MLSRSHLRALPLNDMELALTSFREMEKKHLEKLQKQLILVPEAT